MAPFAKTTFVTGSLPAASATELNNFGDGIVEAQRAPYVTALPTTGPGGGALVDGQECYYLPDPTDATGNGGVAWHLKYRLSDTKWYFIGGSPLMMEVLAEQSHSLATYSAVATAGPSITLPLAGDYNVEIGCATYVGSANAYSYMSYDIGATGAADADAVEARGTATGNIPQMPGSRRRRKNGLAAATALVAKYRSSATGGAAWKNRWMAVVPVRVS